MDSSPSTHKKFAGIAQSRRYKSGISVRFSHILHWRYDRPAADSLEAAIALLGLPVPPGPTKAHREFSWGIADLREDLPDKFL